jgi:hypothetical protein
MENAKDSFYVALRNRLAAVNPDRKMLMRSADRPGILIEEAEAVRSEMLPDVFLLRWKGLKADFELPAILTELTCEISYTTAGSAECLGLDRGRALEAMDAELMAIAAPMTTRKMDYSKDPPSEMATMVFWTSPEFLEVKSAHDRLMRSALLHVFAFQERGEL